MSTIATFKLGEILGTVGVPDPIANHATKLAGDFYQAQEESDFAVDLVETFALPLWLLRYGRYWLPDVAPLGYKIVVPAPTGTRSEQLVATAGCDMHTDDDGLVLMVVLHNADLTFRQGRVSHRPRVGDWFIFDDRKPHGVKEAKGNSVFLAWNIPIEPL